MGYTFISYSTKNQAEGDAVRNLFHKKGIRTWMAPYNIPVGSGYAAEIAQAIKNCACFVLLLSKSSQDSMWVDKEVERALSHKKSVIVIQLEDIILNDSFEFYLGNCQIQSVKKIDENAEGFRKILEAVIALAGTELAKSPAVHVEPPLQEMETEQPSEALEADNGAVPLSARERGLVTALRWVDGLALLAVVAGIILLVKSSSVYAPLCVFLGIHTLLSLSTIAETMILTRARKRSGGTGEIDSALSTLMLLHLAIGITCIVFFFLGAVFTLYAFAFSVAVLVHYILTMLLVKGDWSDIGLVFLIIFGVLTIISIVVYF